MCLSYIPPHTHITPADTGYKHSRGTRLLGYYVVGDIFENNPASPDISCSGCLQYMLLHNQAASWCDMFLGSLAARAACWSNDLIRFALITVLLVTIYSSISECRRAGGRVIESGNVSLSSCQERCYIVLLRCLCVGECSKWISLYQRGPVRIIIQIF